MAKAPKNSNKKTNPGKDINKRVNDQGPISKASSLFSPKRLRSSKPDSVQPTNNPNKNIYNGGPLPGSKEPMDDYTRPQDAGSGGGGAWNRDPAEAERLARDMNEKTNLGKDINKERLSPDAQKETSPGITDKNSNKNMYDGAPLPGSKEPMDDYTRPQDARSGGGATWNKKPGDTEKAAKLANKANTKSATDKRSLAEKENASTNDGQDSAKTKEEDDRFSKYKKGDPDKRKKQRLFGKRSRRKKVIIGFAVVGVAASIFGATFILPTLAVRVGISKVTEKFMDRVSYATEQRVEKYVEGYIQRVIGPSLQRCGTVVSADCTPVDPNVGVAGYVYQSWSNSRIEDKLIKKYGLSFVSDLRDPNNIQVFKDGKLVGDYRSREATKAVAKDMRKEVKFKGVRDRWRTRLLLSRKHNAKKWCFIACAGRDDLTDVRLSAVKKFKLRIATWIGAMGEGRVGTYMLCLIISCDLDTTNRLADDAAREALDAVDDNLIREIGGEIGDRRVGQFVAEKGVQKVLEKFLSTQTAQRIATGSVPVVGQIYLAAVVADLVDRLDSKIANNEISQFIYDNNIEQLVQNFALWQSTADDIQSTDALLSDVGAAVTVFKDFDESRLWGTMEDISPLSARECEDGVILSGPTDPLVCPEMNVRPSFFLERWRNSPAGEAAARVYNTYGSCYTPEIAGRCLRPRTVIRPILEGIDFVFGAIADTAFNAIGTAIPPLGAAMNAISGFISEQANALLTGLANKLIPKIINPDAEGPEVLDQFGASANAVAEIYMKGDVADDGSTTGLGGQVITDAQAAELSVAIKKEKEYEMKNKSIFARYFDINDDDSLISQGAFKLATTLPIYGDPLEFNLNPIESAYNVASSYVPGGSAYAQGPTVIDTNRSSIFNITDYAIPIGDPAYDVEPDDLTPEVCAQFAQDREDTAEEDPDTGEIIYTQVNPCMLDHEVRESLAKIYNLDPPVTPDTSGGGGTPGITAPGLNGFVVPSVCSGINTQRTVVRMGPSNAPYAIWDGIPNSGAIGYSDDGLPINVYIKEPCASATDVKTVVIVGSIHGSENGGQFMSHDLLFNRTDLPQNARIVAIPNLNPWGSTRAARKTSTGVNLNRNFDTPNWYCNDAAVNPCNSDNDESNPSDPDYRGTAPNSEPETQALVNFLSSIGTINLSVHVHDNLNWVAYIGDTNPAISARYAANVSGGLNNRGRVNQHGGSGYWTNLNTGAPSLLVEMSSNQDQPMIDQHVDAVIDIINSGDI